MATRRSIEAGRAFILIEAIDKTGKIFRSVSRRLDSFSRRIALLGSQMLALGGALAIPLIRAVNTAASFEHVMADLQAVLGITDKRMQQMEKTVRSFGRSTTFTAQEVASAGAELARGGFAADEVEDSLGAVLSLARTGNLELAEAAKVMVRSIRVFGLTSADSASVADKFFTAARNGTTTVQELAQAFSFSSGTADELGLSLDNTLALLTVMANRMLFGTKGGTSLNQMLLRMGTRAEALKSKFDIDVLDQFGNVREPLAVMKEIANTLRVLPSGAKLQAVEEIFNVRGARAALVLQSIDEIVRVNRDIEQSAGEAAKAQKKRDATIFGSIKRVVSAFDDLSISVGKSLGAPFKAFEETIVPIVNGFSEFVKQNQHLFRTLAMVTVKILAFGAGLVGVAIAIKAVSVLVGILGVIAAKAFGILIFLVTNLALPFLGLIAVVTTFLGVIHVMGKLFPTIGDAIDDTFGGLPSWFHEKFSSIFGIISDTISGVVERIKAGDIIGAFELATVGLNSVWITAIASLQEGWVHFTKSIKEIFIGAVSIIKDTWLGLQADIAQGIIEMAANSSVFNEIFKRISGVDVQAEVERGKKLGVGDPAAEAGKVARKGFENAQKENEEDASRQLAELNRKYEEQLQKLRGEQAAAKKKVDDVLKKPIKGPEPPPETPEGEGKPRDREEANLGRMTKEAATKIPDALQKGSVEAAKKALQNSLDQQQVNLLAKINSAVERQATASETVADTVSMWPLMVGVGGGL